MGNELTVIIPFLNEGNHIKKTLSTLRESAGDSVDVILIDDCSNDNYNYRRDAKNFNCQYMRNDVRKGVAGSRDRGIYAARTPFVYIVDGHMSFLKDDWYLKLPAALKEDPRAIWCTRSSGINADWKPNKSRGEAMSGAYMRIIDDDEEHDYKAVLEPKWLHAAPREPDVLKIPCVLGANYFFSVDYYKKLGGLSGLRIYSGDEAFLCYKAWMEGGSCKLLNTVNIGHYYRNGQERDTVYRVDYTDYVYNKLFMVYTLFEPPEQARAIARLQKIGTYPRAALELKKKWHVVESFRQYFRSIQTRPFSFIARMNRAVKDCCLARKQYMDCYEEAFEELKISEKINEEIDRALQEGL